MREDEQLQRLEAELRKTVDIIDYLQYQLRTKRSWKRETEFKITQLQSSDKTGEDT